MSSNSSSPEQEIAASEQEQEQAREWLAEADAAAKTEDWDKSIASYRKALEFDRYLDGGEAKLQWALRMRDIDKLYRDGKAKVEAGQYEAALVPLRKARVMYASHYKDVDELIVQAQTELQKQKWEARPAGTKGASDSTQSGRGLDRRWIIAGLIALALVAAGIWFFFLRGGSVSNSTSSSNAVPAVTGTTSTTPGGVQVIDVQTGSGREAQSGSQLSMHYTGYLTDGTKFDSSLDRGQPFEFQLGAGDVIKGWDEGIVGMKEGGKRRLIIPPQLGYGAAGHPPVIPPNATLIFDVELLSVK